MRIPIAHFKIPPFAKAPAQAVDGEIADSVTARQSRPEEPFGFIDGDDIRQALRLWRLDQVEVLPGLVQHGGVVELKAVPIELDGAPGGRVQPIGAVIGHLLFG